MSFMGKQMQLVFCELLGQRAPHSATEGDSLIFKSYVMGS